MLDLYAKVMGASGPFLRRILDKRERMGKEDRLRVKERMGHASRFRPKGRLIWIHAASVGEAQSTLVLIDALLKRNPALHILVTTGTVTSATLLAGRLPPHVIHQYYPLDHPVWVSAFLDHWQPDLILWMESELWPVMLNEIRKRKIHLALINARLSDRSFRRWRLAGFMASRMLSTFDLVLAQTAEDKDRLDKLGAKNTHVIDNLKYGASPLPCDPAALSALQNALGQRPLWLFASTHAGEEDMACRLHRKLELSFPGLLTVIAPRHPDRRAQVAEIAAQSGLNAVLRSSGALPSPSTQIYIADTLGELGLLYRLSPLACIGRSFSDDGGGGHNPIEAARLGCAVLYGPNVQNQTRVYADMQAAGAALPVANETDLEAQLRRLLSDRTVLEDLRARGLHFTENQQAIVETVLQHLDPLLSPFDPPGLSACA